MTGTVNFDRAPIKYALNAPLHLSQNLRDLPHFNGISTAYDIGVGAGRLWLLLRDVFGICMSGLDSPVAHAISIGDSNSAHLTYEISSFYETLSIRRPRIRDLGF